MLWKWTKPAKVGRNGVTYKGLRYGQYEAALFPLLGKEVRLRVDPNDLTRVSVWSIERRFICVAPANQRLPHAAKDEQSVREANARQRSVKKARRAYFDTRNQQGYDLRDHLHTIGAENVQNAANAAAAELPPTLRMSNTENDDELLKLAAALKLHSPRRSAPAADQVDLLVALEQLGREDRPPAEPTPEPFDLLRQRFVYDRLAQEPEEPQYNSSLRDYLKQREAAG